MPASINSGELQICFFKNRKALKMRVFTVLLFFLSLLVFVPHPAFSEEASALEHKKAGDLLAAKEDYRAAAEEYSKALSADRGAFTLSERARMALSMSWGGRLDGAIEEFKKIKAEEPSNIEARKNLARALSWSGRLKEAAVEIEYVLAERPEEAESLVVKANILRWQGRSGEAIPLYNSVLSRGEDFDARMGLAYALIESRRFKAASDSKALLKTAYPYQEREMKELHDALSRATRPTFDLSSAYYNDSDFNQVRRFALAYGFLLSDLKAELRYRHTDAEDRTRDKNAESFSFYLAGRLGDDIKARAGAGAAFKGNGGFFTGLLGAETNLRGWTASAGVSRDLLTDTAQIVENGIRVSDYSLSASRASGRTSLYGSYNYRRYSDDNSASDLSVTPRYTLKPGSPRVDIGYRFRYLDFDRQSGGGYFDPENFIAHQLLLTLSYEHAGFYAYLEPYYGWQSFDRNGASTEDFFGGGAGVIGYRTGRSTIELSAEGGAPPASVTIWRV